MSEKFDVIIVGGGMGGLALAWALARQGRSIALIERQREISPLARGELLQPNGLRVLDQLGLLEDLKSLPSHTAYRYHFHRIGKGRLLTVDYRMLPPPWNSTLILPPHHLLNQILKKLLMTGRVCLFTGTEFVGLLPQKNGMKEITSVQGGETIKLQAPLVVGSDGAYSRVRTAIGIRARIHAYKEAYLTMIVPRPDGFEQEARYYVGCKEILGLFPISEKELYLFYMIPAVGPEKLRENPLKDKLVRLVRIDEALEESLKSIRSWEQVGYMPCVRVRADRWSADGAVLMGDAAHAINPHVAQGRNQALEDALALRDIMDHAFHAGDFSDRMFRSYETKRRPVVEALQRQADEMVFFWNAGFPPLMWLRDRVFKTLDRNARLRYKMLALIAGRSTRGLSLIDRLAAAVPIPSFSKNGLS
jgi:6-methylpretetramide 4-monooxygenase